jgi:hypothetical protein
MLTLDPHASLQKEKGESKRGIIFIRYRLYLDPFFALLFSSLLFSYPYILHRQLSDHNSNN